MRRDSHIILSNSRGFCENSRQTRAHAQFSRIAQKCMNEQIIVYVDDGQTGLPRRVSYFELAAPMTLCWMTKLVLSQCVSN